MIRDIYSLAAQTPSNQKKLLVSTEDLGVYIQTIGAKASLDVEVHANATQVFQIISGTGEATVGEYTFKVASGLLFQVPRGVPHRLVAGPSGLKFLTIYGPAKHEVEILSK